MEWFSYVIAVGVGLSAVLSPWFVTKTNNKHQLSLKKLDMYENAKRKALHDFISASTNLHCNNSLGGTDEFFRSVNCLYIYFKNIPSNITSIESIRNEPKFFNELTNIVQKLSQQITKE